MPQISSEYRNAIETVSAGLTRAQSYVLAEALRGYDPYDALTSPVFRLPLLRSSRVARRGAQQVLRRIPVNTRPLLGIHKGLSPVTVALVLQAWAYRAATDPSLRHELSERVGELVSELATLRSPGWSGACWGYEFDWETRGGNVPALTPTIVATGFVANSLFVAHELLGGNDTLELCRSAGDFVLNDLNCSPGAGDSFCWSYSPLDHSLVLNATAKGSRLLAQLYSRGHDGELKETAARSLRYVVEHQRGDGSWPYAVDDPRTWADNFHTGYILDALAEYAQRTGDHQFAESAERGWRYYRSNFFEDDLVPRYYDTSTYPIDATAVAQSLFTLTRFGDVATALRVASWAVGRMQRADGSFVYQIHRRYVNRVPYMRWSTAWMLCGLACVLRAALAGDQDA